LEESDSDLEGSTESSLETHSLRTVEVHSFVSSPSFLTSAHSVHQLAVLKVIVTLILSGLLSLPSLAQLITWKTLGPQNAIVFDLLVEEDSPRIDRFRDGFRPLYVVTPEGVYTSADGTTWQQLSMPFANDGESECLVTPLNEGTSVIYADKHGFFRRRLRGSSFDYIGQYVREVKKGGRTLTQTAQLSKEIRR